MSFDADDRQAVDMQGFVDDDDGYVRWLAGHADEFVLNTERIPRPAYVVLHRAIVSGAFGAP